MAKKKKEKAKGKAPAWPKIRAAIIAYFVVFNVIAAVPTPGSVSKQTLERPVNQAELKRWVALMRGVGMDTDADRLGNWYLAFAATFERTRAWAVKPIERIATFTQTWQGWRLFGMPDERPYALRIEVTRPDKAEVIYTSGDPGLDWNGSFLEYRRVRAVYNPGNSGPPDTYQGFGRRVSDQIFAEMPDVERVRISLLQSHTTLPGHPADPEIRDTYPQSFDRSGM